MSQVNWQTAEEVIRMIEVYNQVIQGMGPAVNASAAAAALGFTKTASGMYVKSVVTTTAASAVAEGAAAAAPTAAATAPAFVPKPAKLVEKSSTLKLPLSIPFAKLPNVTYRFFILPVSDTDLLKSLTCLLL